MIRTCDCDDLPQLLFQAHDVFAELNVVHPGGDTEAGGVRYLRVCHRCHFFTPGKGWAAADWITESVECVHTPQDGGMEGGVGHLSPLPPQSSSPATRRTATTELFLLLTDQADDSSVFSPLLHVCPPPFTSTPPPPPNHHHRPSKTSDLHLLICRGPDIAGVKHQKQCVCGAVNETPVRVRVRLRQLNATPRPSRCTFRPIFSPPVAAFCIFALPIGESDGFLPPSRSLSLGNRKSFAAARRNTKFPPLT